MSANWKSVNKLNTLTSKYYKYLETLCQANNIDLGALKSEGGEIKILELFFGGMPILVGFKYFSLLRILRLFGQDISSLKALAEVSNTLEELWICESNKLKVKIVNKKFKNFISLKKM